MICGQCKIYQLSPPLPPPSFLEQEIVEAPLSSPPFHSHQKQQKADTIIGTFLLNKSECTFAYNICELWTNITGTCSQKESSETQKSGKLTSPPLVSLH